MKVLQLAGLILFLSVHQVSEAARGSRFGVGVEPIVGYELDRKLLPEPHKSERLVYGGRVTVGIHLIAVEGEYTRADDEETYAGQTFRDVTDKIKVGLRSAPRMGRMLRLIVRGGAAGRRNRHEIKSGDTVVSTTSENWTWSPYGGLGVSMRVSRMFSFSGTITVVFHNFPRMADNEYQTVAGFKVRLP